MIFRINLTLLFILKIKGNRFLLSRYPGGIIILLNNLDGASAVA
jgi:hypothetical protein